MTKPKISIIVAIGSKNRVIGKQNELLFHIGDDFKRFKSLTLNHPIIMGRKTFESIGHPLPERINIVVTRNVEFKPEGVIIFHSIEEALQKAKEIENLSLIETEQKEIFIIGGGEIYKEALPFTDKIYLTIVESDKEGDIFFPDYSNFKKETFREERRDEKTGLKYSWVNLEK